MSTVRSICVSRLYNSATLRRATSAFEWSFIWVSIVAYEVDPDAAGRDADAREPERYCLGADQSNAAAGTGAG